MPVTHDQTLWKISKKSTPPEQVFTTTKSVDNGDDLTVLQIPHYAGLQPEQAYVVECIHVADNGLKSEPGSIDFTPVGSSIQAPVISYPVNNSEFTIGADLVIQASPFVSTPNGMPHSATDWRISTTNNPESASQNESSTNLTSYTVSKSFFQEGTSYYLFARYKSGETYSSWSMGVKITTSTTAVNIQKPTITSPAAGSTVNGSNAITLTSSSFVATGDTTHAASVWQISKSSTFDSFVLNQTSHTSKTSFVIPANTMNENNTVYYARVQYKGSSGESSFSDPVSFTNNNVVSNPIATPSITNPSTGSILNIDGVMLYGSTYQFNNQSAATHTSSMWQISEQANFSTLAWSSDSTINRVSTPVPSSNLTYGKTYYARVKYKSGSYASEFSAVVSFSIKQQPAISNINIISPSSGFSLAVSNTLNIVASDFTGVGGAVFTMSTFQVASDSSFSNIVWSTSKSGPATTSVTVPANSLTANMTLYVRVGYYSSDGDIRKWSNSVTIQTTAGTTDAVVNTPIITSPQNNAQLNASQVNNLISSAFSATGGLQMTTHHWQISTDSGFSSLTFNQESAANGSTTMTLPANQLAAGTTYYARVRHWGNVNNGNPVVSSWSGTVTFTTTAAVYSIVKPTIISPSNGAAIPVNTTVTLEASIFNATSGVTCIHSQWQFGSNADFTGTTSSVQVNTGQLNKYPMTPTVPSTSMKYVRMNYVGIVNNNLTQTVTSEWSAPIGYTVTSGTVTITKPTIITPADGAIFNLTNTDAWVYGIQSSGFSVTPGGGDTHYSSTWQLAKDVGFNSVIAEIPNGTGSYLIAVAYMGSNFSQNPSTGNNYYVRVRHNGQSGAKSEFSNPIRINVTVGGSSGGTIAKPTITYPSSNGTTQDPKQPIGFMASSFSGGSLTHTGTEWQLAVSTGFSPVFYTNDFGFATTQWSIPAGALAGNTTYYIRVRYKSGSTVSDWSNPLSILTAAAAPAADILTPSILDPSNGSQINTAVANVFRFMAFTGHSCDQTAVKLMVSLDPNFLTNNHVNQTVTAAVNTITVPAGTLQNGKSYYAKVQYIGKSRIDQSTITSSWSVTSTFTTSTSAVAIEKPSTPTTAYSGNDYSPLGLFQLRSGTFNSPSGLVQTGTEWEVATDSTFSTKVTALCKTFNNTSNSYDVETKQPAIAGGDPRTVRTDTFVQGKTYWVRYRFISNSQVSPWSDAAVGTVVNGKIWLPSLTLNPTLNIPSVGYSGGFYKNTSGVDIPLPANGVIPDARIGGIGIKSMIVSGTGKTNNTLFSTCGIEFGSMFVEIATDTNFVWTPNGPNNTVIANGRTTSSAHIFTNGVLHASLLFPAAVFARNTRYYLRFKFDNSDSSVVSNWSQVISFIHQPAM